MREKKKKRVEMKNPKSSRYISIFQSESFRCMSDAVVYFDVLLRINGINACNRL